MKIMHLMEKNPTMAVDTTRRPKAIINAGVIYMATLSKSGFPVPFHGG
jgi:hypothetical protein